MKSKEIKAKLPKSVKRITVLKCSITEGMSSDGERVVVRKKRKRKKQSKGMTRLMERVMRRTAKMNSRASDNYLKRHRRSKRKRRDGWLRDLPYNWTRSRRKGNKELKLSKIFG